MNNIDKRKEKYYYYFRMTWKLSEKRTKNGKEGEKMYKVILIDIDDTLFDYKKAEDNAIRKVFEDFGYFKNYENEKTFKEVKEKYSIINKEFWEKLEKGLVTKEELKTERFKKLFEATDLDYSPSDFSRRYLKRLGEGNFLFDGAEEFCKYIKSKYKVAIVTNGIKEVQMSRIGSSGISGYIDEIVISDEIGIGKPHPEIFEYALKKLGHENKRDVIMIGDSQTADIQGGINFGIDTCWINIVGKKEDESIKATYKVNKIEELYGVI